MSNGAKEEQKKQELMIQCLKDRQIGKTVTCGSGGTGKKNSGNRIKRGRSKPSGKLVSKDVNERTPIQGKDRTGSDLPGGRNEKNIGRPKLEITVKSFKKGRRLAYSQKRA